MTAIQTVVNSWMRTPFAPHCKTKGQGVDCVQLAFAIYDELGLLSPGAELPRYSLNGMTGEHATLPLWLDASPDFERVPDYAADVGCILVFRFMGVEKHCGVMYEPKRFVHVWRNFDVGPCNINDPTWKDRLTRVYRNVQFHQ